MEIPLTTEHLYFGPTKIPVQCTEYVCPTRDGGGNHGIVIGVVGNYWLYNSRIYKFREVMERLSVSLKGTVKDVWDLVAKRDRAGQA